MKKATIGLLTCVLFFGLTGQASAEKSMSQEQLAKYTEKILDKMHKIELKADGGCVSKTTTLKDLFIQHILDKKDTTNIVNVKYRQIEGKDYIEVVLHDEYTSYEPGDGITDTFESAVFFAIPIKENGKLDYKAKKSPIIANCAG